MYICLIFFLFLPLPIPSFLPYVFFPSFLSCLFFLCHWIHFVGGGGGEFFLSCSYLFFFFYSRKPQMTIISIVASPKALQNARIPLEAQRCHGCFSPIIPRIKIFVAMEKEKTEWHSRRVPGPKSRGQLFKICLCYIPMRFLLFCFSFSLCIIFFNIFSIYRHVK